MILPVGKVKLIVPPKPIKLLDLWGEDTNYPEGRLRLRDVCQALDADVICYCDEDGCEVLVSAHDAGVWRGFSTEIFKCNQELVMICRKKTRRTMDAMVPFKPPNNSGAGTSGMLLEENEGMQKLLEIRRCLKAQFDEIDERIERLSKLQVK